MECSHKIKKLNQEIALYHKELIRVLDKIELETLPSPSKVAVELTSFEEITNLTYKLYEKDRALYKVYREKQKSKPKIKLISDLKGDLMKLKREIVENNKLVTKEIKKVSLIVKEYRERCKLEFTQFLKGLDIELRKALKPLVPNEVLNEQIKYKPINEDWNGLDSLNSTMHNEPAPGDSTEDKLNNHIQLLVNTLEGVAKSLIEVTTEVDKKYYEIVDPSQLNSDPPSPLAAPLPEYFSFDLGRLSDETRESRLSLLNEKTKKKIIKRINEMEVSKNGCLSPRLARRIKRRLETLIHKRVNQLELLDLFKEEGVPISKREQLVFDIINSARDGSKHVTLNDLMGITDEAKNKKEIKRKPSSFEVSDNDYSQIMKKIEGRELEYEVEGNDSLQSSIDDRLIKSPSPSPPRINRGIKRIPASDKHLKYLPEVSVSHEDVSVLLDARKQQKDVRVRSFTPGKPKVEDKRVQPKRSKTPALRKKRLI
ncbi:unnamed protein product [Blepharisma stoltei]|uniref:Uncharacterized protein n=1 Tax=Blepharisma stoltei TaxID=1481888 RepID=A0AAU9JQ09_9CILI|nr:unnamed protein product [Blepharisma stoltei]